MSNLNLYTNIIVDYQYQPKDHLLNYLMLLVH